MGVFTKAFWKLGQICTFLFRTRPIQKLCISISTPVRMRQPICCAHFQILTMLVSLDLYRPPVDHVRYFLKAMTNSLHILISKVQDNMHLLCFAGLFLDSLKANFRSGMKEEIDSIWLLCLWPTSKVVPCSPINLWVFCNGIIPSKNTSWKKLLRPFWGTKFVPQIRCFFFKVFL